MSSPTLPRASSLRPATVLMVRSWSSNCTAELIAPVTAERNCGPKTWLTCCPVPVMPLSIPWVCCTPLRSEEHTSELQSRLHLVCRLFFLKDTATPEISTLSLHDALPILRTKDLVDLLSCACYAAKHPLGLLHTFSNTGSIHSDAYEQRLEGTSGAHLSLSGPHPWDAGHVRRRQH